MKIKRKTATNKNMMQATKQNLTCIHTCILKCLFEYLHSYRIFLLKRKVGFELWSLWHEILNGEKKTWKLTVRFIFLVIHLFDLFTYLFDLFPSLSIWIVYTYTYMYISHVIHTLSHVNRRIDPYILRFTVYTTQLYYR